MGIPKHLTPSIIPNSSARALTYIDKDVAVLKSITDDGNEHNAFLSLKYLQNDYQCFCEWQKQEMGEFWEFNRKLHSMTWQQICSQAGIHKTGLGYTILEKKQYPNTDFTRKLSQDITLFELRVSKKARVHGFRMKSVFFMCWLDRNHEMTGN